MQVNVDLQKYKYSTVAIGTKFSNCRFDEYETKFAGKVVQIDIPRRVMTVQTRQGIYFIKIDNVICNKNLEPYRISGEVQEMQEMPQHKVFSSLREIHKNHMRAALMEAEQQTKKEREKLDAARFKSAI